MLQYALLVTRFPIYWIPSAPIRPIGDLIIHLLDFQCSNLPYMCPIFQGSSRSINSSQLSPQQKTRPCKNAMGLARNKLFQASYLQFLHWQEGFAGVHVS